MVQLSGGTPNGDGGMRSAVYADVPRRLTSVEREGLSEALDSSVPDSGCAEPQSVFKN